VSDHSDCAAFNPQSDCGYHVTIKAIKGRDIRQGMIVATLRFERIIVLRTDKVLHRAESIFPGTYVWEMDGGEIAKNQIYVGSEDYVFDVTPRDSNKERAN
jgi:hypothetical protein